jgi:hypothetical protein
LWTDFRLLDAGEVVVSIDITPSSDRHSAKRRPEPVKVALSEDKFQVLLKLLDKLENMDLPSLEQWLPLPPDEGSEWAGVVGPVYSTTALCRWLGITRQALAGRVQRRTVLRLETDEHDMVYPGFQFNEAKESLPGLSRVLTTLALGTDDEWTWAAWLNTPDDDGLTHAQRLRRGEVEQLLPVAAHDARAWRGGE